jgi:hypothetical protein
MNHRTFTGLAAVSLSVLLSAGCSSGADSPDDDSSTAGRAATSGGSSSGANGSGGASAPPTGYSSDPVVVESDDPGQLAAVTAAGADGVDRLTFQFSGTAPGYRVEQVDRVTAGPEGDVVEVNGRSYLNIAFTATTPGAAGPLSEDVPTNEEFDLPMLRQVVLVHNVGGELWFGVGVDAPSPTFRVVPLDDPTRLVVEVRAD